LIVDLLVILGLSSINKILKSNKDVKINNRKANPSNIDKFTFFNKGLLSVGINKLSEKELLINVSENNLLLYLLFPTEANVLTFDLR
jgi:hypothetical protein